VSSQVVSDCHEYEGMKSSHIACLIKRENPAADDVEAQVVHKFNLPW
jgi:hypothetical protein